MPKDLVITTYEFSELDEQAQDKVLEKYGDINIQDSWWYEFIYENAESIGLKITGFDLDRRYCKGKFIWSVEEVIEAILEEHGKSTETYKDAMWYKPQFEAIKQEIDAVDAEGYGWDMDEGDDTIPFGDRSMGKYSDLMSKESQLEDDFLYDLLEDYRSMLQQEWDYQASREAIVGTLEANDYRFTKEGKVM